MKFFWPIENRYPVLHPFGEWGEQWPSYIDPDTGYWIPKRSEPGQLGQHCGIDFACPIKTLVSAMADGTVVKARYEEALDPQAGAGLHVIQIVNMPGFDAWWLRYAHLDSVYVHLGEKVRRGQPIGESGRTGDASEPMLHVDLMDPHRQYHPIEWQ